LKNTIQPIYIKTKDFLITSEEFSLLHDLERDLLVTHPQPKIELLSKYYESEEYISHTDNKKGLVSFLYQFIKTKALQKKTILIRALNNGEGSLLDIGAGTGDFLKHAKQSGWKINGVEPNKGARELAAKKGIGLESNIDDFTGKTFEVITLWHVLEHLPNLEETIYKIEKLLKPAGILIIAVPNFKSYDARYYKNYWAAFDVPRHLWHFSRKSMTKIFSSDLTLFKTKPMIFDSYYVSLLSEKNKTGKQNLIKAFFIGLRSNIAAWKTKEYSSLIYCFKKDK